MSHAVSFKRVVVGVWVNPGSTETCGWAIIHILVGYLRSGAAVLIDKLGVRGRGNGIRERVAGGGSATHLLLVIGT